jgi:hypothetical protein
MGASYSTNIPSATERQKERYGAFSLRTKQIQTLRVLNDLITELMSDDSNLISLMKLMKDKPDDTKLRKMKCEDLFIVLSSSLKKEFQVFKFPDPLRPSDSMDVAYLPVKTYQEKISAKDDKRKTLCNSIAWFMTRFVTLVFALVTSLDAKRTMSLKGLKDTSLKVPDLSFVAQKLDFDSLVLDQKGSYTSNLVWINSNKVLIDKNQGIVFIPKVSSTGVAKIIITEQPDQPPSSTVSQPQTAVATQQQLFAAGLGLGGLALGGLGALGQQPQQTVAPGFKLKTYLVTLHPCLMKSRQCYGFELKPSPMSGQGPLPGLQQSIQPTPSAPGGPGPLPGLQPIIRPVSVSPNDNTSVFGQSVASGATTPSTVVPPPQPPPQRGGIRYATRRNRISRRKTYKHRVQYGGADVSVLRFLLRQDGMTKAINEFEFKVSFPDRVETFLKSISDDEQFKTDVNPYLPLSGIDDAVIERIRQISSAIQKVDSSFSPAQLRAYLLATNLGSSDTVMTSFCDDPWQDTNVTNILAYGLLDALFKDLEGNKITTVSQMEYKSIIDQFLSNNIMKASKDDVLSFHDLEFTSLPDELEALCERDETSISNPIFKELLMNAHKSIRDLYDQHMQNVITFITSKLISPKLRGYRENPVWTLNPAFSTDTRGAPALLESLIKEVRIMLAKHYFRVESIYASTIDKLKGNVLGIVPPPKVNKLEQ